MINRDISSNVIVIGTSPDGRGGIASVIAGQKSMMEKFNFIKIHQNNFYKFLLPIIAFFKSFRYISPKYRIVHIHSASFSDFYRSSIFVFVNKLLRKKIILHIHGAKFEEFYKSDKKYIDFVCNKADVIATVSTYFADFFKRINQKNNVWLLPNFISDKLPDDLPDRRNRDSKIVFSYFGALDNRKGIFDVIKAIGKYKHSFKDNIQLIVGGNGDTDKFFDLVNKENVEHIVKYVGWLDSTAKDRLLRNSDVFIHPSSFESFGISILEAMSYQLPIITTTVGGIPDLVTNGFNGITVEPGNIDRIAEAIFTLIDNPSLRLKLGENSKLRAAEFTISKTEDRYRDLYSVLLQTKSENEIH